MPVLFLVLPSCVLVRASPFLLAFCVHGTLLIVQVALNDLKPLTTPSS
jgi:hypothetical protein